MNKPLRRLELALVAPFFPRRPVAARRFILRFDGMLNHSLMLFLMAAAAGIALVAAKGMLTLFTMAFVILPPAIGMAAMLLLGLCFPGLFGPRQLEPPRQFTLPIVFLALTVGGYLVHVGTLPVVASPGYIPRTDQLWKSPVLVLLALALQVFWLSLAARADERR